MPIIDSIMEKSKFSVEDESYDIVKQGVAEFLANIVETQNPEDKINKLAVDEMIAHIDNILSAQMDEILHHEEFQKLESTWRGLNFLVGRTDFNKNIKIVLCDAQKEEILDDFEANLDITQSAMYKQVYSAEYGQFGGEPIGCIISDYDMDKTNVDMNYLNKMSSISAMSHSVLLTTFSPKFFGLTDYSEISKIKDLKDLLEGPQYTRYHTLRENENAKYIGALTVKQLGRSPYLPEDNPIKSFNYTERIDGVHKNLLWTNSAYSLGTCLTDSFSKYGWCGNIIGPKGGGEVRDLPTYVYENYVSTQAKIPTETLITDRMEYELAENGFIALTLRRDSNNATFFSANSVLKPKIFPNTQEGKEAETNYRLGTQLPYLFLISRLAHYLKVIQREEIGTWKERIDVERGLNEWLRQYISDQENPPAAVRSARPFKGANVVVSDVPGEAGWYRITLSARPHFKYMGSSFELSLVGKLDKE
ncbi:MAG: type VI secretion system contractile sheath large subunit [Campylobacter sp.]|nr:type VI secretion system contractile sheath large subunit [Campylobacter sp.]